VRLLGEDLVLFRDTRGRVGLLADHCSHRGASLLYGRVEERGIACAYHGWLYDTRGCILETPPERNEAIMRTVRHRAYPVQEFLGLYWAYLGPLPAPVIPRYDVWWRKDGVRRILVHPRLDCNWFQTMENAVDPAHLEILHQDTTRHPRPPPSTTRGYVDDVERYAFELLPYGIMKTRAFKDGRREAHPLIFPNVLRVNNGTEIRVPIDDAHTLNVQVDFYPTVDGRAVETDDPPEVEYPAPYKEPPEALHPFARMKVDGVAKQDHGMWETQGPIVDRTAEHLSYSDRGVALLRRVVAEQIDLVARGRDPLGLVRDPAHPMIDTNLDVSLERMTGRGYLGPQRVAVKLYPYEVRRWGAPVGEDEREGRSTAVV
jgi:5,5'-dehydrodivanillate O-demethylase